MIDHDDKLDVVIRQGDRSRTVPPESLAAVLRLPSNTIRTALARLLFAYTDPDASSDSTAAREPTEGVGNGPSDQYVPNVSQPDNSPRRERDGGECGGAGERGDSPLDATALAVALDDLPNLAALKLLVARHSAAHLRAALTITLACPPSSIRSTRGAYFTGVLRALAARDRTLPTSHA